MPTSFICRHCELRFSAGWYHYHRFSTGYGSRTLLVCTECGTQHALEWAVPDRGPPFVTFHRLIVESVPAGSERPVCQHLRRRRRETLADAMAIASNPPFVLFEQAPEEVAARVRDELAAVGIVSRTEFVERQANPNFGPIMQHRLLYHPDPSFTQAKREWVVWDGVIAKDKDPQEIKRALICQHCHAEGTLASEVQRRSACPSCKEPQLVVESQWIT